MTTRYTILTELVPKSPTVHVKDGFIVLVLPGNLRARFV